MSEDKKENTKIVLIRPEEGVFETYSNFVDAVWTLFDVTFRFAQIVPAPPESTTGTTTAVDVNGWSGSGVCIFYLPYSLPTRRISASTIFRTNSSRSVLGFQPSLA